MSIVYGIVKQHNGFITIDSEPGKGTTFMVYIPLNDNLQNSNRVEKVPTLPLGGSETILVAEDDGEVRKLVTSFLTRFGYKVLEAADGEDAVSEFTAQQEQIDLVLLDMIMPRKSGWETAMEISRIRCGTKILYLSGYTADFLKNRGVPDDQIEIVSKPLQPMELLRKVRAMLDA